MNQTLNPVCKLEDRVLPTFVACLCLAGLVTNAFGATHELESPDRTVRVVVSGADRLTFSLTVDGKTVVEPSEISMTLKPGAALGRNVRVTEVTRRTIQQDIRPVVPEKFAVIRDHGHEMTLNCEGGYAVAFRAYNNGIAYRFQTSLDGELTVTSEQANLRFAVPAEIHFPEEDGFISHNERNYLRTQLDSLPAGRLASLPVLVTTPGARVLLAESALRDYPGMWVRTGGGNTLNAVFPAVPIERRMKPGSDRNFTIDQRADFIAKTDGTRSFPWRVLALARQDAELLTNQLVFQLAEELKIADPSWIRPGQVAWDWWNANNLHGVNFRAGINTQTYQHYIDFAASLGIEYIILDEGWYKLGDLLAVVPEIDVPELVEYGRKKNVGIILWVIWKTLDDQLEEALDLFEKWGVVGLKVDFMQADDQWMVNYYWRIAEEAARRKMLVDFHGAYKPAGLRRAYPNVITREGVQGLEHNKWSTNITATHNLTLPFIRMVTGPMDYTPGAMINAQPEDFRAIFNRPMSLGTRAHQVAMYVVYESPLQMLADSPSNYAREAECARFISRIPTTWDETIPLHASVGEYVALARRSGRIWYLGAMTNEKARELDLNLSFLDGRDYVTEIIEDGINADRHGNDYRTVTRTMSKGESLKIQLAPGGGWAAILTPE
jgi:alpha-glucosidase